MKRIFFICLAILWLVPSVAMAHSKLENAVPAQDSTAAVSPESIEMTFNTKIESLSNFKLLNAAGEVMEKGKTAVDGMTMSAAIPTELPNGIYQVKWTIIGADGHSVEGDYSFTVDVPVETAEPTTEPDAAATEAPAETVSPTPEVSPVTDNAPEATQGSDGTNYTPAIIIGVIIVIAAAVLMLRRRK